MNREKKVDRLGQSNVYYLLLTMSVPAVFGNLSNIIYYLADRLIVGNYQGRDALGAIAVITPLNNIMTALTLFLTVGGASYLSISLGKKEEIHADQIFSNICVQAVLTSSLLSFLYFVFAGPLVILCGAKEGTVLYELAVRYLRIICFGQVFQMVQQALAAQIRAEGSVSYSMKVFLTGGILNILLDVVLVAGCRKGIQGAAIATVISQFASMTAAIAYYMGKKHTVSFMGIKEVRLKEMVMITKLGAAPALYQGLAFLSNIVINRLLRYYGDAELAAGGDLAISAMSVIATMDMITILVIMGINQAVSPIVSYNYGAGNYERVEKASKASLLLGFLIGTLTWGLMMGKPEFVFSIFSRTDTELTGYGAQAMKTMKVFACFIGVQTLASMFFSAIGKPKIAVVLSLIRQIGTLIPALFLFTSIFGLKGVFYAQAASDLTAAFFVLMIYIHGIKKYVRKPVRNPVSIKKIRQSRIAGRSPYD